MAGEEGGWAEVVAVVVVVVVAKHSLVFETLSRISYSELTYSAFRHPFKNLPLLILGGSWEGVSAVCSSVVAGEKGHYRDGHSKCASSIWLKTRKCCESQRASRETERQRGERVTKRVTIITTYSLGHRFMLARLSFLITIHYY